MPIFKKEPKLIPVDPFAVMRQQTELTMKNERDFWDDIVRFAVGEDSSDLGVTRAITAADRLIEARRERYPIQG